MSANKFLFLVPLLLSTTIGAVVVAGCSHSDEGAQGSGGPGERMGGPSMGGPGGGRFAPVAASATSAEIFQQKCQGCHGADGQGGNGPNLAKSIGRSDDAIFKLIHDGEGRMSAFGNQMTDGQIKQLVTYVRGLNKAK